MNEPTVTVALVAFGVLLSVCVSGDVNRPTFAREEFSASFGGHPSRAFERRVACHPKLRFLSDSPLLELGRLVPLQLAWSLSGKRAQLVQQGKLEDAMTLDKLVTWAPRNGSHRIHQGCSAYLTGNKEKALAAFRRAMELDPNGYKAAMDAALANPATAAYRKMLQEAASMVQLPQH